MNATRLPRRIAPALRAAAWLCGVFAPALALSLSAATPEAPPGTTRVASPEIAVMTSGDQAYTLRIAARLEVQRRAYLELFQITKETGLLTVILFGDAESFRSYALSKGHKDFSERGGYFPDLHSVLLPPLKKSEDVVLRVLSHEVVHHYNYVLCDVTPVWFDEGMAMYFEDTDFSKPRPQLGKLDPLIVNRLGAALKEERLLKVADLCALDYAAFHVKDVNRERLHYDQSWALVHMLVHAKERLQPPDAAATARVASYLPRLLSFMTEMRKTRKEQARAWERALVGLDRSALEGDYRAYIRVLARVPAKP
jgi:hypothetical protein